MAAFYLLLVILPGVLAAPSCELTDFDELVYYCPLNDGSSIVVKTIVDSYINIKCNFNHGRELNFTCADVPEINLANGFVVPSLSTDSCPPSILQCVTRAFNATGVTKLVLKFSTKSLQEDDVKYMDKVTTLMIRNGKNQSFPYFLLSHLPNLKDLRFLDTPLHFDVIQPVNHKSLRILHLLSAKIPHIPPGAFDGLKNVVMFSISENKFEKLSSDALKGLESLEYFYCVNNPLKLIESGIFSNTPKLVNLTLENNSLESIPTGLFNGLEKLENVIIKGNQSPLLLGNKTFANLPSLKKIELFKSQIQWLPDDMFSNTTQINYVVLSENHIEIIPENIFLELENLKGLDLSHNNIKQLSNRTFSLLKKMTDLNLNWNHLEVLPNGLFPEQLGNLKTLYLDHNRLHTINKHVFGNINLEVLSMASNLLGNEITYANLGGSIQTFPLINSLEKLILRNNSYDTILYEWWALYYQLQLLDLSSNKFTKLDEYELQFNSIGITVDLRNNNISTVTLAYGINNPSAVNPTKSKTVLLDNNPFICDCNIYQLLIRNGTIVPSSTISEPAINVGNSVCVAPVNLKGRLVKKLSPSSVTCDIEPGCPEYCSSCKYRPKTNLNEYHCKYFPNLPKPDNPIGGVALKLDEPPKSINSLVVKELHLSGLGINHVRFKPSPDLRVLDLSNNALVKPPVEFFNSNISLYLAGNRFECSCSYIDELKLMKTNQMIIDYDNITCEVGSEVVYFKDVNVATLCYNQKAAVTAAATFTVLLIVGITIGVLVYKYYDRIQIYLMHKSIFARFYEDAEDLGKVYDCFISYSHKDAGFVEEELIPKLENEFNQKTCIHYRDWDVGENILTQIHRSVESSRKTVIVLSEDFLKSMWATVEFNLAHSVALRECRARVILLLLGDVAEHPQLSEELKSYIKTNTYLSCSDQKFWEKLERALPARKKRFVWKKSGEEKCKGGLNVQLNSDNKLVNLANKV